MTIQEQIIEWVQARKKFQGEAERRISICKACPNHRTALVTWCGLCGCNMLLKAHLPSAKCPDEPPRW